jgi:hypothetical protein
MTPEQFRATALALAGTSEGSHQGHPDFRVRGRIFASLGPDGSWAMVRLPPDVQAALVELDPKAHAPARGAWGAQGATIVVLAAADPATVREAVEAAWAAVAGTAPRPRRRREPPA